MQTSDEIQFNNLGFYELKNKPSQQELTQYYQDKYFKNCDSYNYISNEHEIKARQISSQLLLYAFSQICTEPMTSLYEIGFGEGYLLQAALKAGYKVRGVDFSVDQIVEQNKCIIEFVNSSPSPIDSFLSSDDDHQLLCMQHVLEHVPDPVSFAIWFVYCGRSSK